jgi:hypothetical protein
VPEVRIRRRSWGGPAGGLASVANFGRVQERSAVASSIWFCGAHWGRKGKDRRMGGAAGGGLGRWRAGWPARSKEAGGDGEGGGRLREGNGHSRCGIGHDFGLGQVPARFARINYFALELKTSWRGLVLGWK